MTQAPFVPHRSGHSVAHVLCALGVAAAVPLHLVLTLRLVAGLDAAAGLPFLAGLALGALAADLFTGLVHWGCDTWGSARTPLIGPTLIHSFREHHVHPEAMREHDWVFVNREPAIAATVALAALLTPAGAGAIAGHPLLQGFLCAFIGLGAGANQLHAWAHAERAPGVVRWLQRRRLVLSPNAHARHHHAPNLDAYCISSGWLNPPLDAIGFWRGLERAIQAVTGVAPRSGEAGATPRPHG